MKINGQILQRLEALVATGMPGAHRVLVFFLINSIYGVSELGRISSWFSLAQIVGFFTAIGWSTLILVRVARAENHDERIEELNKLMLMGLLTLLFSCALVLPFGVFYKRSDEVISICYLLIGWTFYQMPRHYFIALRRYRHAIFLDGAILILTIAALIFTNVKNTAIVLALPMLLCGVFALLALQKSSKKSFSGFKYEIKGLEFGLSNFLSGGMYLSLIPLAKYFESDEFAGVFSLFLSITAIAMLLPRAISINQLPTVAKSLGDKNKLRLIVGDMKKQIFLSNLVTSIFSVCVAVYFLYRLPAQVNLFSAFAAMLLIVVQSFIGTQSLVGSNVIMSAEMSRALLAISATVTALFFVIVFFLFKANIENTFLWLCLSMALLNLFRFSAIKIKLNLVLI